MFYPHRFLNSRGSGDVFYLLLFNFLLPAILKHESSNGTPGKQTW